MLLPAAVPATAAEAAFDILARGFAVFPLSPGTKKPLAGSHGYKDATTDEAQVRAWFAEDPSRGVAVALGAARTIVVDIDGEKGRDSLAAVQDRHGRLPSSWEVATPGRGGGRHVWLAVPEGFDARLCEPWPGIEIKTLSAIVPPSIHPDGPAYAWIPGASPMDGFPLAEAPSWLLSAIEKSSRARPAFELLVPGEKIPEGGRHNAAVAFAGKLRRAGMEPDEIEASLLAWNRRCSPPMKPNDLRAIAHSARTWPAGPQRTALRIADPDAPPLDDIRNAQRFADDHRGSLLFVPQLAQWHVHDGRRWIADTGSLATMERAMRTARSWHDEIEKAPKPQQEALERHARRSCHLSALRAMSTLAQSIDGMAADAAEFDRDPFAFNCANGTVDLRTGTLRPHDPADRVAKISDVAYDESATCPRWRVFLDEVFGGDGELAAYFMRALGYMLCGSVEEHAAWVWHGLGCNGKSLAAEIVAALLGEYFVRADSALLLEAGTERRAGEASPHVAALRGGRMAVCSETGRGRKFNEAALKELTGGDRLTARELYGTPFTFEPTAKIVVLTNAKPHVSADAAVWRRLRLVPFNVSFAGREDRMLSSKLKAELPGILAWAVESCIAWQREGLREPHSVLAATKDYREAEDVIARFVNERCTTGPQMTCSAGGLYAAYKQWAEDAGEFLFTQTAFGTRMNEMGFGKKRVHGTVLRVGICLEACPDGHE